MKNDSFTSVQDAAITESVVLKDSDLEGDDSTVSKVDADHNGNFDGLIW